MFWLLLKVVFILVPGRLNVEVTPWVMQLRADVVSGQARPEIAIFNFGVTQNPSHPGNARVRCITRTHTNSAASHPRGRLSRTLNWKM